jgi:hypothetical protein
MQNAYKDINIQLLPNTIIQELSQKTNLVSQLSEFSQSLSTSTLEFL